MLSPDLEKRLNKKSVMEEETKMAKRRFRRFRIRRTRRKGKNLRKRTFTNRMYKKGVARAIHTTAKYLFKKARLLKRRARVAGRKARR